MSEFLFEILTPVAPAFQGKVATAVLPGQDGYFGVLKGHQPLVAAIKKGLVKIRSATGEREWQCGPGVAAVDQDKVVLLVESLTDAADSLRPAAHSVT